MHRLWRLGVSSVLALALLGVSAAPTLAARPATAREAAAIKARIRPQIPQAWRPLSIIVVRVSTIRPGFAIASIRPKPGYEGVVETATAFLAGGGRAWQLLDLGSADVGCGVVPARVRAELQRALGFRASLRCNG